jgi:hypothetical protein
MLTAEKATTLADIMPSRSKRKGGPTKANSTAVVPLAQKNGLGLQRAIMAQPNLIQVVLVIEDMPKALITLIPANKGVYA